MQRIISIFVLALTAAGARAQTLTAADAIQRIKLHYSVPPHTNTVDTIKVGDPATPVNGIAVTFLATMDVLRQAQRLGCNLIITHEPTFYNHVDDTTLFASDPVYQEKLAFLEQHHMVVFRFHDGIHESSPDHIATGLIHALGWDRYIHPEDPFFVTIPPTTILALARELETKLKIRTLRIVGDPNLPITHVAIRPGAAGLETQILALRRNDVEVLLVGEAAEWETVEYARDAEAQGRHKALILLGHEVSEEPGMEQSVKQLRPIFPGIRIEFIPANQPLWSPEHPPVLH